MSRREQEKEIHRMEILEGAKRVFARKGYAATTMDEIAEETEFSKGAIYTYFPSKERLFICLFEEKIQEIYSQIRALLELPAKSADKIEKLIDVHLAFFEQDLDFFRIITTDGSRFSEETINQLHKEITTKIIEYTNMVSKVMSQGISEKFLKNIEPHLLAMALTGMVNAFTAHWIIRGETPRLTEMKPIIMELFLKGATFKN